MPSLAAKRGFCDISHGSAQLGFPLDAKGAVGRVLASVKGGKTIRVAVLTLNGRLVVGFHHEEARKQSHRIRQGLN